jgi:hypothetical protein
MRLIQLTTLALLASIKMSAQDAFEPGYFINNQDEKIECLIKNTDRNSNPLEFTYKRTQDGQPQTAHINEVKEFNIGNGLHHYIRHRARLYEKDRSNHDLPTLKDVRFKEALVFLRVLVNGQASLYHHRENNTDNFFYKTDSTNIELLVFTKYITDDQKIVTNNRFRQDLAYRLKSECVSDNDYAGLGYNKRALVRLFSRYNQCVNAEYTTYATQGEKKKLEITVKGGINLASLTIEQKYWHNTAGSDAFKTKRFTSANESTPVIGIELAYPLSFGRSKWSIFFEPTFVQFKTESQVMYNSLDPDEPPTNVAPIDVSIDYTHIDLPLGVRYAMPAGRHAQVFFKAALVTHLVTRPDNSFTRVSDQTTLQVFQKGFVFAPTGSTGAGFRYKDRLSIEGSLLYNKIFLEQNRRVKFKMPLSVILGYRVF